MWFGFVGPRYKCTWGAKPVLSWSRIPSWSRRRIHLSWLSSLSLQLPQNILPNCDVQLDVFNRCIQLHSIHFLQLQPSSFNTDVLHCIVISQINMTLIEELYNFCITICWSLLEIQFKPWSNMTKPICT